MRRWRITTNGGLYRVEYLEQAGRDPFDIFDPGSLIDILRGLPKEDVWIPCSDNYGSFEQAEKEGRLRFGQWKPVNPGSYIAH